MKYQMTGGLRMNFKLKDFSPEHTFECGQCFRWERQTDKSYIGVAGEKAVRISAHGDDITIDGIEKPEFESFWRKYLDCDRDYGEIKKRVSVNPVMKEAVSYGGGIRILRQEFHEALISFIISQRSSIPRIKTCVRRLCERYGESIYFEGKQYFTFPAPEKLAQISEKEFSELGTGYRAPYLYGAAQSLADGTLCAKELSSLSTPEARKKLLSVRGIGDKVCDCILLFSLGKYDLFPSDVWIKRTMAEYFGTDNAKEDGERFFGEYSGFAQQYLFYWRKSIPFGKAVNI